MKQRTLAMTNGFERYGKKTRRAEFLEEMEQVVPEEAMRTDRAALSEDRQRAATSGSGTDAAHVLPAAVVQPV